MSNQKNMIGQIRSLPRATLLDVGLIGGIGVIVAAVHILASPAMQASLAFNYQHPDVSSLFTSAFIHYSDEHLLSNLAGYVGATSMTYVLSRQYNQRWWFRWTVVTLVVGLPMLVTLTSYVALTELRPSIQGTGRGFSGVTAGFIGFMFTTLLVWLEKRHSREVARSLGTIIFISLLLEVVVIYHPGVPVGIIGFGLIGITLSGWQIFEKVTVPETTTGRREAAFEVVVVGLVVGLLGTFVLMLFPKSIVQQGSTTNIISHGAGFMYGFIISGVSYWLFDRHK